MFTFAVRLEVERPTDSYVEIAKNIDAAIAAIRTDDSVKVKIDSIYCYEKDDEEVKG